MYQKRTRDCLGEIWLFQCGLGCGFKAISDVGRAVYDAIKIIANDVGSPLAN